MLSTQAGFLHVQNLVEPGIETQSRGQRLSSSMHSTTEAYKEALSWERPPALDPDLESVISQAQKEIVVPSREQPLCGAIFGRQAGGFRVGVKAGSFETTKGEREPDSKRLKVFGFHPWGN